MHLRKGGNEMILVAELWLVLEKGEVNFRKAAK